MTVSNDRPNCLCKVRVQAERAADCPGSPSLGPCRVARGEPMLSFHRWEAKSLVVLVMNSLRESQYELNKDPRK